MGEFKCPFCGKEVDWAVKHLLVVHSQTQPDMMELVLRNMFPGSDPPRKGSVRWDEENELRRTVGGQKPV